SRVRLDQARTAFHYDVRGPLVDQQRGTAVIILTAQSRRLHPPEKNKVNAHLETRGKELWLIVTDNRTGPYNGELLEISIEVRWDKPWSLRNPVVFERTSVPLQIRVRKGTLRHEVQIDTRKTGEFWIDDWKFRRAKSRISSDKWIKRGEGNTVEN
ncbi:hypothetical protein ACFL2T_04490, partial [Elusimicrobiota bacterium]